MGDVECWNIGVMFCLSINTPTLHYSNPGAVMEQSKLTIATVLIAFNLLLVSTAVAEDVFVGNPGKSLNFFHFDLAIERGFFKELGLDVKLLSTKCDIAVTALLTGDLQATGCVGSALASRRDSLVRSATRWPSTPVTTKSPVSTVG